MHSVWFVPILSTVLTLAILGCLWRVFVVLDRRMANRITILLNYAGEKIDHTERSLRSHVVDEIDHAEQSFHARFDGMKLVLEHVEKGVVDFIDVHFDDLRKHAEDLRNHAKELSDRAEVQAASQRQAVTRPSSVPLI